MSLIPGSAIVFLWNLEQSHFTSLVLQFPIWKKDFVEHVKIYRQKAIQLLNTKVILIQQFIIGIKNYRTLLNDRSSFLFLFGMIMGTGRVNREIERFQHKQPPGFQTQSGSGLSPVSAPGTRKKLSSEEHKGLNFISQPKGKK